MLKGLGFKLIVGEVLQTITGLEVGEDSITRLRTKIRDRTRARIGRVNIGLMRS